MESSRIFATCNLAHQCQYWNSTCLSLYEKHIQIYDILVMYVISDIAIYGNS